MRRKLFRKYLPDAAAVREKRWIRVFGSLLQHPNLWSFNRDSVAGAVAIGLAAGLVPGPLQVLAAILLAVPLKRNLPVAIVTTFYTNPFTIVPLYVLAYGYGSLLVGKDAVAARLRPFEWDWSDWGWSLRALGEWMLGLGLPLAVGLPALALTFAVLGYIAVQLAWRAWVVIEWRARKRRREAARR